MFLNSLAYKTWKMQSYVKSATIYLYFKQNTPCVIIGVPIYLDLFVVVWVYAYYPNAITNAASFHFQKHPDYLYDKL